MYEHQLLVMGAIAIHSEHLCVSPLSLLQALQISCFHRFSPLLRAYAGILEKVIDSASAALDGKALTREELVSAIAPHMRSGMRRKLLSGWGSIFKPAAYRGRLCFGPSRGQNITFVRPDQWLGE